MVFLAVLDVFRLALRRIVYLRRECVEVKKYIKEMKLAEQNIDATETAIPPMTNFKVKTVHCFLGGGEERW